MSQNTNEINAYLVFKIGDESFAAHAGKVQRILELQPITSVPKSQIYMKGVINLMGKVLPVIDARLKMGMEEKEADNNTCIIVLEVDKGEKIVETGIIVDAVQSVVEVKKEEFKNPPEMGIEVNSDFISGMVEKDSKFIMLLDIDNIFSIEEVVSISEAAEYKEEETLEKEAIEEESE